MTFVKKLIHSVRKEFQLKNCGYNHSPPDDFVRSQWQSSSISIPYIVYRWIVALFFTGVVLSAMGLGFMSGRFFIYFTNWGIMMCMITNLMGAILVSIWYLHPKYSDKLQRISTSDPAPTSFSIYWALHTTTLSSSLVVTIIYWGILYNMYSETIPMNVVNVFEHALNSILMIIDLFIVAFPIRIYHIFLSILFVIIYAIFSVLYYFAGGTDFVGEHYIYPILDWSKPGEAMITVSLVAVLYAIFPFILFSFYKLRVLIHAKYNRNKFSFPSVPDRYSFENRAFHNDGIPRTSL